MNPRSSAVNSSWSYEYLYHFDRTLQLHTYFFCGDLLASGKLVTRLEYNSLCIFFPANCKASRKFLRVVFQMTHPQCIPGLFSFLLLYEDQLLGHFFI